MKIFLCNNFRIIHIETSSLPISIVFPYKFIPIRSMNFCWYFYLKIFITNNFYVMQDVTFEILFQHKILQ